LWRKGWNQKERKRGCQWQTEQKKETASEMTFSFAEYDGGKLIMTLVLLVFYLKRMHINIQRTNENMCSAETDRSKQTNNI